MIGFFRRVRKKLADDNQFLKYSRYAIGEIVLVMVGILLALQVNNWNEERKQTKEIKEHLIKVAYNISEDIAMAERHKVRRDSNRLYSQNAIQMLLQDKFDLNKIRKGESFFYEFYFVPNKSGYEALKSSGYLSKIKNNRIDSLLHEYYVQIDYIEDREISYNEFIENVELEFKLNNSMFEYIKFVRHTIDEDLENNTEEMKKLKSLVMTTPFQAGLVRTSRNGTRQYEELIEIGNEYLKEL